MTAPGATTDDLRQRLEVLASRVGDVPHAYRGHLLAILAAFEELLGAMTEPHHPQTGDTP